MALSSGTGGYVSISVKLSRKDANKQMKIIGGCYFELIVINHYQFKIKVLVGNTFIANKTSVGFLVHNHILNIIYFIP